MASVPCPQSPGDLRFNVKPAFRNEVARRFGGVYATGTLSPRTRGTNGDLFAPVVVGPGGVQVFMWPAIALDEGWLDRVAD